MPATLARKLFAVQSIQKITCYRSRVIRNRLTSQLLDFHVVGEKRTNFFGKIIYDKFGRKVRLIKSTVMAQS